MLNSLQNYLQGILDGVTTPQTAPIQAFIMPPQIADAAGGPIAYVWGARLTAVRQTAPRIFGQQKLVWDATVSVTQAFIQDDENIETAFPLVIDQIMATLMTTPLQNDSKVWLDDPITGNQTQLLSIGEHFSLDYESVHTTGSAGEGLWVFVCDLIFPTEELVSFQPGTYYNPT